LDDMGRACADLASPGLISAQSNADKSQEDAGLTTDLSSPDAHSMSFATLQVVRNMELKLLTAIAVLKATMETLDGLVKIAEEVYQESSHNSAPGQKCPDIAALQDLRRRASLFHLGADHVKCRTERLVDLLTDGSNQKAELTASGMSRSVLELTRISVDENVTVRVITVITMIYLPTQFVATFFGTNFVQFQTGKGSIRLAKDSWIFLAAAIPLTLMTLGAWVHLIRRRRQRNRSTLSLAFEGGEKN